MLYNFDCENIERARAALLLYALYRSRDQESSINGLETWDRMNSYVRGAGLKSSTTAEFVQNFCRKAKISSLKPRYLKTGDLVTMPTGEIISSDKVQDYRLDILEDDSLLPVMLKETIYIIMLVRERIQREKLNLRFEEDEDADQI